MVLVPFNMKSYFSVFHHNNILCPHLTAVMGAVYVVDKTQFYPLTASEQRCATTTRAAIWNLFNEGIRGQYYALRFKKMKYGARQSQKWQQMHVTFLYEEKILWSTFSIYNHRSTSHRNCELQTGRASRSVEKFIFL